MTASMLLNALAALLGLVVAVLAVTRVAKSPLALPLALVSLDQFAWNAASVGVELMHEQRYHWVGAMSAPLFVPFAFHFVLAFIGARRAHRRLLFATYVVFGLQALFAILRPGDLETPALALLVTGVPTAVLGFWFVARHHRAATNDDERLRAKVLLVALGLATAFLTTDLFALMHFDVPPLAALGSFSFSALVTHITLDLRLLTGNGSRRVALGQAVLLALFIAGGYLLLIVLFQRNLGVLTVMLCAATTALLALLRLAVVNWASRKAGLERFAVLGRFSAQMAHDLKNPLAAAKGAAAYLAEELRAGRPPADAEFANLVVEQLDRLQRVIERYQRLSSLEAVRVPTDLNALVKRVLSLQLFAAGSNIKVEQQLHEPAPMIDADADLLSSALENLVKNAFEAMPNGGSVTVSTTLEEGDAPFVRLGVRDTGTGFDARAKEQAFELFYTSKATGSGLGLAFVKEVAVAHGGDALLTSTQGTGTLIELRLPLRAA